MLGWLIVILVGYLAVRIAKKIGREYGEDMAYFAQVDEGHGKSKTMEESMDEQVAVRNVVAQNRNMNVTGKM